MVSVFPDLALLKWKRLICWEGKEGCEGIEGSQHEKQTLLPLLECIGLARIGIALCCAPEQQMKVTWAESGAYKPSLGREVSLCCIVFVGLPVKLCASGCSRPGCNKGLLLPSRLVSCLLRLSLELGA